MFSTMIPKIPASTRDKAARVGVWKVVQLFQWHATPAWSALSLTKGEPLIVLETVAIDNPWPIAATAANIRGFCLRALRVPLSCHEPILKQK